MLYNLLLPYIHTSSVANLFHYISFRSGLAVLLSFILTLIYGPILIRKLKDIYKNGQPIRDDGPITHFAKAGTPTMGGLMIIVPVLLVSLLLTDLTNPYIWVVLFVMISFAAIGYLDDITKIKHNNHKGVSGKTRMLFQIIITIIACLLIEHISKNPTNNTIAIPYFKKLFINLGYFYVPFAVFIIVGAANAVNLTDGLDGLAIVPIAIASLSFGLISYLAGNSIYSNYLQLTYLPQVGELTVFCSAIVGGALGFLWFNCQPAEIFMGDTGSLSLGGILGTISVITKHEIVFAIIGGLFVIETLSVIIQVYYFKATGGKRIFKMAPLHHHFEQKGWQESKVVIRFWIMAIMFALLGLSSLKLR